MSASDFEGFRNNNGNGPPAGQQLDDVLITCMDCSESFVWTVGEQLFFRDKNLTNPPKRCKACKRAKNRRLEAIQSAKENGRRQHFEVKAKCAKCDEMTTVPFYPSQGRPVYCRRCFLDIKPTLPTAAGGLV